MEYPLGHYRLATVIPLVATQAVDGTLFSFRWGNASKICELRALRLSLLQTVAATATILPIYSVFLARAFTASDSVGTALTLTGNSFKTRTGFDTTSVTDIRKSAVAAGLTAGTRTLDAEPILQLPTISFITTPNTVLYQADLYTQPPSYVTERHRLVKDEGLIVRGPSIAFGAAGAANLVVDLAWSELAA